MKRANSPLFEIALGLVRFEDGAGLIVNSNHSIMGAAVLLRIADCIAGSVRAVVPQPAERQHIGD
jgi:hypothetical protein